MDRMAGETITMFCAIITTVDAVQAVNGITVPMPQLPHGTAEKGNLTTMHLENKIVFSEAIDHTTLPS